MHQSPLLRKLEAVETLSSSEVDCLQRMCVDVREISRRADIVSRGDDADYVHLMLEGWGARYFDLPDGSRQITAFLIPGDFCDIHVTTLAAMDHGIIALTNCRVAFIGKSAIEEVTRSTPALTRAFWRATLVDEAILRQWIVSLGRRDAKQRIAHMLCELHLRLRLVGLTDDGNMHLPLTQEDIADACGLTPVHVNRTVQGLRKQGLVDRGSDLHILNVQGLRRVAAFDPSYLHLKRADRAV
ncbi:Crp/Fnr family transcriptional regulator [Sphingomonas crocodyli]|nr:Crp/Fnr family transcriptional regulator [Sphingomonas crocodyli]